MKTSSKIAIAAAAVGAWLIAKKKAISGIGTIQAYASRKKLAPYFNGDWLISRVVVDLTTRKGNYVDVTINFFGRMPVYYWVAEEDIDWLSDMCKRHREEIIFYD